jgi:hypothetical protein
MIGTLLGAGLTLLALWYVLAPLAPLLLRRRGAPH